MNYFGKGELFLYDHIATVAHNCCCAAVVRMIYLGKCDVKEFNQTTETIYQNILKRVRFVGEENPTLESQTPRILAGM